MPPAFPIRGQVNWRLESARKRLALALAISLIVHGLIYSGWLAAPTLHEMLKTVLDQVLPRHFTELQPQKEPPPPPPPKRETELTFVEVDPALAAKQPPKETKNYSTHDSVAANPELAMTALPKIDGVQKHVQRTTDNPKPQPKPMQPEPVPTPVEAKPEPKPPVESKPKPAEPGDLAMAKPTPKVPDPGKTAESKPEEKPHEKPRTLQEAMQRNPSLAGQKMAQDGGVIKHAHVSMLDARGSPFGNYDNVFIGMVQQRWYGLLDNNGFMLDRRGKVALTFRLHYDGRITRLETEENTVGDVLSLLCQKAILDPAPFPKWPTDMRQRVGVDYRDVKFTFFYE